MRKIKFRGKRIDNGQWVYGMPYSLKKQGLELKTFTPYIIMFNPEWDMEAQVNYLRDPVAFSHLEDSVWKVIPDSVGQYIGEIGKKRIEIYEKDIVAWCSDLTGEEVIFKNNGFTIDSVGYYGKVNWKACKVIGNTIDNSGLLAKK